MKIKDDFVPLKYNGLGDKYKINSQGVVMSLNGGRYPILLEPFVYKNGEIAYRFIKGTKFLKIRLSFLFRRIFQKEISTQQIAFLRSQEYKILRERWNKSKKNSLHPQIQIETIYRRRCHDCGKPTNNYRCEECWRKIRGYLGEEKTGEEWLHQAKLNIPWRED